MRLPLGDQHSSNKAVRIALPGITDLEGAVASSIFHGSIARRFGSHVRHFAARRKPGTPQPPDGIRHVFNTLSRSRLCCDQSSQQEITAAATTRRIDEVARILGQILRYALAAHRLDRRAARASGEPRHRACSQLPDQGERIPRTSRAQALQALFPAPFALHLQLNRRHSHRQAGGAATIHRALLHRRQSVIEGGLLRRLCLREPISLRQAAICGEPSCLYRSLMR